MYIYTCRLYILYNKYQTLCVPIGIPIDWNYLFGHYKFRYVKFKNHLLKEQE